MASGFVLATASAAMFGLSGPYAKVLIDASWSATGVVFVRLGGAALVFAVLMIVLRPGVLGALRRDGPGLVLYGVLAMALVQVAFFNAVRYLAVPVALLLEYAGPVLVIGWVWVVRRQPPGLRTLTGGGLAIVGLLLVAQIWSADTVSWAGVGWGMLAACCQAGYFLMADRADVHTPPLVLAGVGMVVGAGTVGLLGATGLLPLVIDLRAAPVLLAGAQVGVPVVVGLLVLVSTVAAYLLGIVAIRRIGASRGSLVGLLEVVVSAVASWLLLDQLPAPVQFAGGALILAGIALTQTRPTPARDRLLPP